MTQKAMQSQFQFSPEHYLKGRVPLPPSVLSKPSRVFAFNGNVRITAGSTATIYIQIDDDAHFLVEALQAHCGLQSSIQDAGSAIITDTTISRSWSDRAVPFRDLFGMGAAPKYLGDPNILRPTSTVTVQITSNLASDQQFYVSLFGRKIYGLEKGEVDFLTRRLWYQYVMNVPTLAASAVDTRADVQVYNESDFYVKRLLASQLHNAIIGAAAGAESSEVMMNLKDTTTDQSLFNEKTSARLVTGYHAAELNSAIAYSWGQPFTMRKPWLIRRNGKVSGYFDNKSTDAIANGFNVVMEGIRVFDAA